MKCNTASVHDEMIYREKQLAFGDILIESISSLLVAVQVAVATAARHSKGCWTEHRGRILTPWLRVPTLLAALSLHALRLLVREFSIQFCV